MITADLQQWNKTTADGQVLAVMVSGSVRLGSLFAGVAGGGGFKEAVGTGLK